MSESLLDVLFPEEPRNDRLFGVVTGVVTNIKDPDGLGRVKVRFPWLSDEEESWWARVAVPMAGKEMGHYFLPDVEQEVLVAFEQGDPNRPYVLGMLWNKPAPPPEKVDEKNTQRVIKSRSGHVVRLDDTEGKEKISIVDKSAKNSIVFDTAENTITILADQDIKLTATNGKVLITAKGGVEVATEADFKLDAKGAASAKAGTEVKVEAGTALTAKAATEAGMEAGTALTLKSGTDATLKAGTNLKLNAGVNAELKATGMGTVQATGPLTVKGAVVNIN